METLLYKPLFINPQAYYVFPNINGRLEPKTGSGKEPAIFVGNIEVKTIAHGDIGKKQYFYNTNEIDLSAFSNSLVRISLYTSRGNVVLGEWNLDVVEGESEDYIDPEILDSLCGVWIADQNTNESESRNIIKNKIADRGGDLELLNFGYKLNSGYGKYEVDFTIFNDITDCTIIGNKIINHSEVLFKAQYNYEIKRIDVESFNAKVENITKGYIGYTYRDNNGIEKSVSFTPETIKANNGIITLPKSYNTLENSTGILGGLYGYGVDEGATITQIPSFEGALVTDGVNDLIVSQKTISEMLGGSNQVTVVSMMLNLENEKITYTNQIRPFQNGYIRNNVISNTGGKYGIYGYKITDTSDIFKNRISINDILGDRKDYGMDVGGTARIDGKFSVEGYCFNDGTIGEVSQVAWYWTFISNKALTTDQINQVISYFNLDKHVKPDIIYDTIRQGITNENHASFNDELVDFSGNGHNMKIYNSAWNKESGINDEGAWQTDGVSDYGNVENLPILKDYTVAIERRWITSPVDKNQCLAFKGHTNDWGAFACEFSNAGQLRSYTFSPVYNILQSYNEKSLVYQSKYSYSGTPIDAKATIDGSTLRLCLPRGGFPFYANVAIKMFLLFPYSLSEFLLERQLKGYKLGTLYPDMVEFRPVISRNIPYNDIRITQGSTTLYNKAINKTGIYLQEGSTVIVYIQPSGIDEVSKITINGIEYTDLPINPNGFYYADFPITKSPQKISYAIDEYIRYEDIVQPYPAIINLKQDGKTITWGDKLKVGSDIVFAGSANLLPELYTVSETRYNGVTLYPNTIIKVEKSMVFDNARTYLKANEPSCILSPNRLRIPNSSYKILGYIPDLTGKGNHGRLNNFAYTEESGANEDGSIRFDGTDDHIIIPTIKHGGKALLMKVNWRYKNNIAMVYDQRINWGGLGISISRDQLPLVAYKPYNKVTYIDGIRNESVLVQDLEGITHNITGIYDNLNLSDERDVCISRTSDVSNSGFADMSMYEFMLFPDVPNEEEIKELNNIIGVEGNTDDLLTKN